MTKRKRNNNLDKMIKEGRGQGVGDKYKPWIKIQDVASLGRVTRLKGIMSGRQHEFLSDMERNYFYIVEYSDRVIDIREQYPLLPLEATLLIAKELGIKHPKNPGTGEDIVMTTDFLITVKENEKNMELARTIKAKDELMNKRVLEKFEIERIYWKNKGIDWGIVTENQIDKVVANNISFVHGYNDISELDCFQGVEKFELRDLTYEFIRRIVGSNKTMRSICNEFDKDMSLDLGSGLSIFKYLVINKIIEVDINKKININDVINIIKVREDSLGKVEVI